MDSPDTDTYRWSWARLRLFSSVNMTRKLSTTGRVQVAWLRIVTVSRLLTIFVEESTRASARQSAIRRVPLPIARYDTDSILRNHLHHASSRVAYLYRGIWIITIADCGTARVLKMNFDAIDAVENRSENEFSHGTISEHRVCQMSQTRC